MSAPLVSVILPVYNCELYIKECVDSILQQTYQNFEVLIFNDGSTDNSLDEILKFNDSRIKVFNSAINYGYVKHLNDGINLAKGDFIIRMDGDDICCKNRFSKLLEFMIKNPSIGVCGSYVKVFGDSKEYIWKLPLQNNAIKALLPFRIPFVHPSVIIKKSILIANQINYQNDYLPAEDYEIWCKLSKVTNFANLPIALLKYRQHKSQISKEKKTVQQNNSDRVRRKYFRELLINDNDFNFYQNFVNEKIECNLDFLKQIERIFITMGNRNEKLKYFDSTAFQNELSFQFFRAATHISSNKIRTFNYFEKSYLSNKILVPVNLYFKFIIKNIFLIGKSK